MQPIFLVSPRYRNEIAAAIEAYGRPVIAARRARDAERRMAQSGARVAVVDARGALEAGLEVAGALAGAVEATGGAMLMLLSRGDSASLEDVYEAGATHFLISPFGAAELAQAIRFAERMARRSGDAGVELRRRSGDSERADLSWTFRLGGRLIDPTPGLVEAAGLAPGEPLTLAHAWRLIDPDGRRAARDAFRRLFASGRATAFAHRLDLTSDGHRFAHHVRLGRDRLGRVTGLVGTVEDLDAATVERRRLSNFDQLTGLSNAGALRGWLETRLGPDRKSDPAAVLLIVSISRFDAINAAYGPAVGDALLAGIGRRLRRLVDDNDGETACVARLGGAEFGIAMGGPVTVGEAVFLAGRIGDSFRRPFICEGQVVHLACRIGIAVADSGVNDAETLMRRSSAALAQAKDAEPNGYQVYMTESDGALISERATLESDLRRALAEDELEILFQPQVEISSDRLVGVEALVRWRHPSLGLIQAEKLLSAAGRAEISAQLGRHIVAKALADAQAWPPSLADLRLSINVTAADLATDRFEESLIEQIETSGFSAHRVTVEVTEGDLIDDLARASAMLAALRKRGLRIAIDDFGTGYSSLAYLKALPLDYMKLDRSLIVDLDGSARDQVVVHAVIDMARSLGLAVIAEGVETGSQLDRLARAGCNIFQGFLAAPPLSSAELATFVKTRRLKA